MGRKLLPAACRLMPYSKGGVCGVLPNDISLMLIVEIFSLAYPDNLPLIQECFKRALEGESE